MSTPSTPSTCPLSPPTPSPLPQTVAPKTQCPVSHTIPLMDPGYSVCGYSSSKEKENNNSNNNKDNNNKEKDNRTNINLNNMKNAILSDPNYHYIFPSSIESTNNNGNSEDGNYWIGPSANQLSRALERKGKADNVSMEDVKVVAAIHSVVTETTWKGIMEYENLHEECMKPTLTRFEGKWDTLSPKAQFLHYLGYEKPFDRHDWYVNRCGKEIKYIIDYYGPTNSHGFHVDVRPTGITGFFDRAKMIYNKLSGNKN